MIFIFEETGSYPLFMGDVQILYPNATPDNLPSGFSIVTQTQAPAYEYGKTVYEVAPIQIEGVWTQQWEKRDMTEEELTSYNAMGEEVLAKLEADGKL